VASLTFAGCGGDEGAPSSSRECGTKQLYGKALAIHVVGDRLDCAQVRQIIRGPCRPRKEWSCFSLRSPDPLLIWFKETERFKPSYSTTIEARRYPCSQATVTADAWKRARRHSNRFPTEHQLLADDLIRCRLLSGKSRRQIVALLGRPAGYDAGPGAGYLDYDIGPERDSFLQVDNEVLSIRIGRDGHFAKAHLYQS
jgi:hypothetical protein